MRRPRSGEASGLMPITGEIDSGLRKYFPLHLILLVTMTPPARPYLSVDVSDAIL